MKKRKKYPFLLFAVTLLFVSSCVIIDELDDDDDDDSEVESVIATINGNKFSASESSLSWSDLGDDVDGDLDLDGDVFELSISGTDLNNGIVTSLTVILYGNEFSSLKEGDEFEAITEESLKSGSGMNGAVGTVVSTPLTGSNGESAGTTLIVGTMDVKITLIDKENELISGEFSFVAYDEDETVTATVTDGKFNNIEW